MRFSVRMLVVGGIVSLSFLVPGLSIAQPGGGVSGTAGVNGTGVKCEQKTGDGYTKCQGDELGQCINDTENAICGDTSSGPNCKCRSTAGGFTCRTQ